MKKKIIAIMPIFALVLCISIFISEKPVQSANAEEALCLTLHIPIYQHIDWQWWPCWCSLNNRFEGYEKNCGWTGNPNDECQRVTCEDIPPA